MSQARSEVTVETPGGTFRGQLLGFVGMRSVEVHVPEYGGVIIVDVLSTRGANGKPVTHETNSRSCTK